MQSELHSCNRLSSIPYMIIEDIAQSHLHYKLVSQEEASKLWMPTPLDQLHLLLLTYLVFKMQSEALQPLSLETAARQQIGSSSPSMVLRTPVQPVPARQHNADRQEHKQTIIPFLQIAVQCSVLTTPL